MPPRTGVGRYLQHLTSAIAELDPSIDLRFFFSLFVQKRPAGEHASLPRRTRTGAPSRLFFQRVIFTPPFTRLYPIVMDAVFRLRTRAGAFDLYHETNYVPRPFDGPTVVTVYDLSLALHPETHPRARVELFRRDFVRRLPWVDRFLAISRTVEQELVGLFDIEPDRVVVTPLGVDRATFHPEDDGKERGTSGAGDPSDGSEAVASLPPRYLLCVGSLEPRKNLATLLRAYARLPAELRRSHPVLLAGPPGWKFEPVWEEVRFLGLERQVRRLGFTSETTLATLYRRATAFVFPSIYEGFGLPPLEAMASGAPVLCSDIPAVSEVVGDAALRVPPHDVEAWREGLETILSDEDLRTRLRSRGVERAGGFTWSRCAEATLGVYHELAGVGKAASAESFQLRR